MAIPRWRQWMGLAGINAIIDFLNQNISSVGTLSSSKVDGAASSTDNAIARFNGSTGKVIQNSTPLVEDDGRISTLTDPTGAQDAATKAYVDAAVDLLTVRTADPVSPANDTAWVYRDGASPQGVELRLRVGGTTYFIPLGTL